MQALERLSRKQFLFVKRNYNPIVFGMMMKGLEPWLLGATFEDDDDAVGGIEFCRQPSKFETPKKKTLKRYRTVFGLSLM